MSNIERTNKWQGFGGKTKCYHLPWLMCSLIHKFGNKEEADYEGFIEDISKYLPRDFSAKGDIYVYVDECHRSTESGELHKAMKKILPNAMFIGFTGTPLLKVG